MLELQDRMNKKIHPEWRTQGFAWYRAIWVECAEMMDHYGWKWWKKQDPNMEQVRLEIIDIWHFCLSIMTILDMSAESIAGELIAGELTLKSSKKDIFGDELIEILENFAGGVLACKSFHMDPFVELMQEAGLSFDDLYTGYVGKNVLNYFRQDNGYKNGTYQKMWEGREDNEHLIEISLSLDIDAEDYREKLYEALDHRYRRLMGEGQLKST